MANAYGVELRERAVRAYRRGDGMLAEVATTFVIDPRTLQRWIAHERTTGSLVPKRKAGGWRCPIALPLLHAVIAAAPDATVAELCWQYNRRRRRRRRRRSPALVGRCGAKDMCSKTPAAAE